jgi:hypothetical protein
MEVTVAENYFAKRCTTI